MILLLTNFICIIYLFITNIKEIRWITREAVVVDVIRFGSNATSQNITIFSEEKKNLVEKWNWLKMSRIIRSIYDTVQIYLWTLFTARRMYLKGVSIPLKKYAKFSTLWLNQLLGGLLYVHPPRVQMVVAQCGWKRQPINVRRCWEQSAS